MSTASAIASHRAGRRRTWSRRPPLPSDVESDLEARFIEAVSGRTPLPDTFHQACPAVLAHFRASAEPNWVVPYDCILPEALRTESSYIKCLRLSCEVADCLRESGGSSIKRLINTLQEKNILLPGDDLETDQNAQHLVFNVMGWVSMLFIPSRYQGRSLGSNNFKVTLQGNDSSLKTKISIDKAGRPLDELLRSFGNLLPTRTAKNPRRERANNGDSKFHVSYLNVAILKTLAGMEIVWVDSLSSHLAFDPTVPSLSLFKNPSFCKLQSTEDSILSIMLADFYEEDEQPTDAWSVPSMMTEVLLSYQLLFKDDRHARNLYQNRERIRASLSGANDGPPIIDYLLDLHCGKQEFSSWYSPAGAFRDSYDIEADFPIFKDRLQRVQDYMEGIAPNRFSILWRDRRDLKLWYTIWAVIILGIIGILQQTISIVLAGLQVNLAYKALPPGKGG